MTGVATSRRNGAWPQAMGWAAPIAIWAAHLGISYTVLSLACHREWLTATAGGLDAASWIVFGLSIAGLAAIVAIGVWALLAWQRLGRPERDAPDPNGRARFLLAGSVLLCAAVLPYMIGSAIMVLVVETC